MRGLDGVRSALSIALLAGGLMSPAHAEGPINFEKVSPDSIPDDARLVAVNGIDAVFNMPDVKGRVTSTYHDIVGVTLVAMKTAVIYRIDGRYFLVYNPLLDVAIFIDPTPGSAFPFGILSGRQMIRVLRTPEAEDDYAPLRFKNRLRIIDRVVSTFPHEFYAKMFGSKSHEKNDAIEIAAQIAEFAMTASKNMQNKCSETALNYKITDNAVDSVVNKFGYDVNKLSLILWTGDPEHPVFIYSDVTGVGYWLFISFTSDQGRCVPKGMMYIKAD